MTRSELLHEQALLRQGTKLRTLQKPEETTLDVCRFSLGIVIDEVTSLSLKIAQSLEVKFIDTYIYFNLIILLVFCSIDFLL